MCGHVGIAGDTGHRNRKMFDDLLLADTVRGPHSTGVAVASRANNSVQLAKMVGPAFHLMGQKSYEKVITMGAHMIMGHNRYATQGEIKPWNAHPFEFKNLVGAHNGTLDYQSIKKLHKNEYFDTDSEAVFCHLDHFGLDSTVEAMSGAWALVWFDKTKGTINFLRNEKRDLCYAYTKDQCTIIWASEPLMLRWCAARQGVDLFEGKIYAVDENKHYEWVIPTKTTDKFTTPTKTAVSVKPEKPVQTAWENTSGAYGGTRHHHQTPWNHTDRRHMGHVANQGNASALGVSNVRQFPVPAIVKQKIDTKKFRPPYKEPDGKIVTKEDFTVRIAGGCVMCQDTNVQWGEFAQFMKPDMDNRHLFLCEECYNSDEVRDACKDLI